MIYFDSSLFRPVPLETKYALFLLEIGLKDPKDV